MLRKYLKITHRPTATLMSRYLVFLLSTLSVWKTKENKTNKFCVFSILFFFFFFFGNSGALRKMEEIDPMAFNNGEEDSGLSMAHTFVNDGSNSKLYPPSKKTKKKS